MILLIDWYFLGCLKLFVSRLWAHVCGRVQVVLQNILCSLKKCGWLGSRVLKEPCVNLHPLWLVALGRNWQVFKSPSTSFLTPTDACRWNVGRSSLVSSCNITHSKSYSLFHPPFSDDECVVYFNLYEVLLLFLHCCYFISRGFQHSCPGYSTDCYMFSHPWHKTRLNICWVLLNGTD